VAQSPNAAIYKINKTAHQTLEELLSMMFGEAPIHHQNSPHGGDGGRPLPISTYPLGSGVPFRRHPLISFCLSPSFSIVRPGRGFMLNQLCLIISTAYGEQVLTAVAHQLKFRGERRFFSDFTCEACVRRPGVAKTPWSPALYRPRDFRLSARTHLLYTRIRVFFSVRS
jgi:hypothetical protein